MTHAPRHDGLRRPTRSKISTAGTYQSALLSIMMAQGRQSEAQRQVAHRHEGRRPSKASATRP